MRRVSGSGASTSVSMCAYVRVCVCVCVQLGWIARSSWLDWSWFSSHENCDYMDGASSSSDSYFTRGDPHRQCLFTGYPRCFFVRDSNSAGERAWRQLGGREFHLSAARKETE